MAYYMTPLEADENFKLKAVRMLEKRQFHSGCSWEPDYHVDARTPEQKLVEYNAMPEAWREIHDRSRIVPLPEMVRLLNVYKADQTG